MRFHLTHEQTQQKKEGKAGLPNFSSAEADLEAAPLFL